MASEIEALLARVEDPALRQDLKTHFDRLRQKRQFGLVFEEHLPERVILPQHRIRRGTKVVPRRDEHATPAMVTAVDGGIATLATEGGEPDQISIVDAVAVAEFGEPIFPGLNRLASTTRGGEKPAHLVVKGENHHALEALQFTHPGRVDCIYIDPPYNTGDKDWIYDNDYVDDSDAYIHSKWLSFIQRRLQLASQLLKPDSALVITIDEHEVSRLGTLLDQLFPQADITLVTIVNNPKGVTRQGVRRFSRVEEYAFFCFFGNAALAATGDDFLTLGADDIEREASKDGQPQRPRWKGLLRSGTNARRIDRKNMFYPVLIDETRGAVLGTGDPLPFEQPPDFESKIDGLTPVWPVRKSGELGNWGVGHTTLRSMIEKGYVAVGGFDSTRNTWALSYLSKEPQEQIASGVLDILSFDETQNVVDVAYADPESAARRVKTVWHRTRHDAGAGGTDVVSGLVGGRAFTFPKSVYAVRDTLEILTKDIPDAVIVDFFAGSGTTCHAAMMLNSEDGGRRQTIVVTNNEVSAEDADALRSAGNMPGDEAWEAQGVYERATRPRLEAAATGRNASGELVDAKLRNADGSLASSGFAENLEFVELTYLDAEEIELDMAFTSIAPLLWMRAGSRGPVIEERTDPSGDPLPYAATDVYAVLFDPDEWRSFIEELPETVGTVFVVTDSASVFAGVANELPDGLDVVRLYENYLSTFAINQGGRR